MTLKKDDWELTLGEARSQRVQALLNLEISNALILLAEKRIGEFKK